MLKTTIPLYRNFNADQLEVLYSPSSMIGNDLPIYLQQYKDMFSQLRKTRIVLEGIAYGTDENEILDFFPSNAQDAPLHIFVHGGYWQDLSQKDGDFFALPFIKNKIAFVSLNYSLAPQANINHMIYQIRKAIGWCMKNAKTMGINANKISLSGHSAGAHLIAMALIEGHITEFIDLPVPIHASLISGIYDLEPIVHTSINAPLNLTIEKAKEISPQFITKREWNIPTNVIVAQFDTPEFIRQSLEYYQKLIENQQNTDFSIINGVNHFDIIIKFAENDYIVNSVIAATHEATI